MQLVKIKDGFVNFDNVTRVRVWTSAAGERIAEIRFLRDGEGDARAADDHTLQLLGQEADALIEWLDGQKAVDLARLHRGR